MKKLLLASSFVFAISGAAQAQEKIPVLSTQELVNVCKTPASPESRSFCVGYEVIAAYMKWVQDNPPAASGPASGTFLRFLTVRFPCAR